MRRPTEVKVGPFTYVIEWLPTVEDGDGTPLSGRVEHDQLIIRVSSDLHLDVQRETLLHEIMHTCNWITGHSDGEATDEQFVRSNSFALFGVLRENPAVARFLIGGRR